MKQSPQLILIVDDVLTNLQVIARIFKEAGYKFILAQSGYDALHILEKETPDLILLDVMMPGLDGFEVCRGIKKIDRLKEVPVIFLTAKNQTEDLVEGFDSGGVDYIVKPFNKAELLIRIKTHLELSNSKKKILEMNKNRDKLYSIIAHDLRTPFSGILFTINAINNKLLNLESEEFMEIMKELETTTNETYQLLNNLLQWTKLQSETITINPQRVNLYSLLMECVQLHGSNVSGKKITMTVDVPSQAAILADEVSIHTVFRNIISNAIKFTPIGGSVNISSEVCENKISIKVKDTGVGISPEVLNKMMISNERHTTRGTSNEHGSGLGFYMVRDFVGKNNGNINVISEVGVGTEVIVELPVPQE